MRDDLFPAGDGPGSHQAWASAPAPKRFRRGPRTTAQTEAGPASTEPVKGNPILLVEDDELDAELMQSALQAAGIPDPVVWVRTGEEALAQLEGKNGVPCLVLLDLGLSKLSGFHVLKRQRECPASREVPTIVVTGSLDPRDIDRAFELGADSYIVKPRDFSSLVEILGFKVNLCLLRSTSLRTGPASEKLGS